MKKQKILTREEKSEDDQISYLAEVLFEAFMNHKGYEQVPWINGETRWIKVR